MGRQEDCRTSRGRWASSSRSASSRQSSSGRRWEPALLQIGVLGTFRETLLGAATERLAPAALFEGSPTVPMSLAAAALVIALWTIVPLALGAWRTCRRDA